MRRLLLALTVALTALCGAVMALGDKLVVMQVPPAVALAESERVAVFEETGTVATSSFYRDLLDENGRAAYDELFAHATLRQRSFDILIPSTDSIEAALHAVVADHPELFWLDGSCTYQDLLLGGTHIDLGYTMGEESIDAVQNIVDRKVDHYLDALPAQASAYDKVKAAYEWVVNTTDYSYGAEQSQNLSSVFVERKSVCAGYSRAFQYLVRSAGVPCVYVRGTIQPDGIDHAWNLVDIDGTLTYVDTTWGDPTYYDDSDDDSGDDSDKTLIVGNISHDYLCLTTEEMERTGHALASPASFPTCDSDAYDYYRQGGLLFDAFDQGLVDEAFRVAFAEGRTGVGLKFTNDEAYDQAMRALADQSLLRGAFFGLASDLQGTKRVSYKTTHDDDLRILKLFW